MNAKIRLTRHEHGLTIADDRTGLRLEVVELTDGLLIESYGYFHNVPGPVATFAAGDDLRHHEIAYHMPDPMPVPARPVR